jgi:TonB family protein
LPAPTVTEKKATPPVFRPKIVFAPRPTVRYSAKFSGEHRTGKFRITFARTGQAARVEVVQTTGNAVLDRAAINALARWKCEPGQSGEIVVPIEYQ